jgi:hypothetical protein
MRGRFPFSPLLGSEMSQVTLKSPFKRVLSTAAVCVVALLTLPEVGLARPYTVVSCDSAVSFWHNASAWAPYSNAGSTYEVCPTNGGFTAGVSNRMTGQRYNGFDFSGHVFTAPPGATITQIRWGGRMARGNCDWGTFIRALPSDATVIGLRNGQFCGSTDFDNSTFPIIFNVPSGTTRLEQLVICGVRICEPGGAMHSRILEVTVDDPLPPEISLGGALVSGQWVSGTSGRFPSFHATVADNAGVSRTTTELGSRAPSETYPCDWSQPRPCPTQTSMTSGPGVGDLSDGRHTLWVSALDAAGNTASVARDVYIDNTPPDPILPSVAGGSGWRQSNAFAASWTNPTNNAAPIIRAHWKLCTLAGACPTTGERTQTDVTELTDVRAPAPGEYRLHIWLEDAAGNQKEANAAVSVPLRFDPDPPEVAFLPPEPADPLRVAVDAVDRHSGLATGEIEMRAANAQTWHGLPTEVQGSQLVAYVDDERFRRGTYDFRARAEDRAGNEASTGKRTDGSAASLRLPARIDTRLTVGIPRKTRRGIRFDDDVVARHGRVLRLRGRVANSDGQPIETATVEAIERRPDGTTVPLGLATTTSKGTFRYVLRATRNRDVVFRYGGSRRIGAATAAFRLRVRAASSIEADRTTLRNGEAVVFSGRVASRPLPRSGKLIEMQAYFRGRWRTFSTFRAGPRGEWKFRYQFGATLGRVTYRFRARLPSEGGYPFVTGNSRVAKVVVLGPL